MDQDRLSSLEMCTILRETANKVINNDIELQVNKFAGKHGMNTHFFLSYIIYGSSYIYGSWDFFCTRCVSKFYIRLSVMGKTKS